MVPRYDRYHRPPGRSLATVPLVIGLLLPCLARAQPQVWLLPENVAPTTSNSGEQWTYLDCGDIAGVQRYNVFVRSDAPIADVVAVELDMRLGSLPPALCPGAPAISPFWSIAPGGCNEGGLVPSGEPPANTLGIASLWGNRPSIASWGAAMLDTLREAYVALLLPNSPADMDANRTYYVGQLMLPKCAAGACAGCDASMEVAILDAIVSTNSGGTSFGWADVLVNVYGICATYEPDPARLRSVAASVKPRPTAVTAASVCDEVPTRRAAWGELKLRYR